MTFYSPSAMEVGEVVPLKKKLLGTKGSVFFFPWLTHFVSWPLPGWTTPLVNKIALHTASVAILFFRFHFFYSPPTWSSYAIKKNTWHKGGNSYHQQQQISGGKKNPPVSATRRWLFLFVLAKNFSASLSMRYIVFCEKCGKVKISWRKANKTHG